MLLTEAGLLEVSTGVNEPADLLPFNDDITCSSMIDLLFRLNMLNGL